jgi:hypothetical protein
MFQRKFQLTLGVSKVIYTFAALTEPAEIDCFVRGDIERQKDIFKTVTSSKC